MALKHIYLPPKAVAIAGTAALGVGLVSAPIAPDGVPTEAVATATASVAYALVVTLLVVRTDVGR